MIKVAKGHLGQEELEAVRQAFEYGYFGHAYNCIEFEKQLAELVNAKEVVCVNTGTSALHLSLLALGIGPGDEVIVPSLTFVASFQAIYMTGATPVPCEVDPNLLLITPKEILEKITPRTKAIMPVHYTGNPCPMDEIMKLAKEKNLRVVEDAAHALGSSYKGKKIGSIGDITCFSFDSIKNITCGEGGAIALSDSTLANKMRDMRLLGINRKEGLSVGKRWEYRVTEPGLRYHMSNINAGIGLVQLQKLPKFMKRRRQICTQYVEAFKNNKNIGLIPINYEEVSPHIFVIRVKNGKRNELIDHLNQNGIEASIHYIPNHTQPLFEKTAQPLPITEKIAQEIVTLPLHCDLSASDVDKVIQTVNQFLVVPTSNETVVQTSVSLNVSTTNETKENL